MNRLYVSMSLLVMVGLGLTLTHYTPRTLSSNYRDDRKLVTEQKWGNQPVEVTDVRIDGNAVALGRSFVANDSDWIHELSFTVRNASGKHISHARFELQFPLHDTPKRAFYVQPLEYGQALLLGKPTASVRPGESFELSAKLDVDVLKRVVREKAAGQYLSMNTARLSAEIIEFTDNTSWVAGEWFRFDRQTKKWIGLAQAELWTPANSEGVRAIKLLAAG